jgi:hypothetical protein
MKFKVVGISSNTNSFGLHRHVFMSPEGRCVCGHKNKQYSPDNQGDWVELDEEDLTGSLSRRGYEIPQVMEDPPQNVLDELFPPKQQVRFFDIEWDTDGEDVELPAEVELEVDKDLDLNTEGADVLSDRYGWCVHGFNFEIKEN